MNLFRIICLLIFGCYLGCQRNSVPSANQTIGYINVIHPSLNNIIDAEAKIEIIASGFTWAEGPLWLKEQNALIFSDVPNNIIYKWSEDDGLQEYLTPSGYTKIVKSNKEGSNGLILDSDGRLILMQHGDRRVARMDAPLEKPQAFFETIVSKFQGKILNSPNDGCFDSLGNLYFTDPPYGLRDLDQSTSKELKFNGLYMLDSKNTLKLLDSTMSRPNGVAIVPDGSYVIVANSDPNYAYWKKFQRDPNGLLSNGSIFFNGTPLVAKNKGLPDGLKIRNDGVIFATGPGGVLIFSRKGLHLGTINTSVATANCAFNFDNSMLYMTAHTYLLRVPLKVIY